MQNQEAVREEQCLQKRKENGIANTVGTTAICQKCGKKFVRNTGNQKLCSECSQKGATIKKKFSEMTQEQRHEEYVKNTQIQNKLYDRLSIYIPKGKKADLQELSKFFGISLNTFVNQAIESYEEQIRAEINKEHPSSD